MSKKLLVDVKNVSKVFLHNNYALHVVKEVNLKVFEGQSIAIMGRSGSGKSSLLHIIGCLERPTMGHYFLDQQNISSLSDDELSLIRGSKIGFVFQSFNLISQFNVLENVELPFLYHAVKVPEEEKQRRVLSAIERVGLQKRLKHTPSELSGGEMQRVAIARALAIQPLLLLADEPTGNLDSETAFSILELFQELNEQGVTLIIVTHDAKVAEHCQQVLFMNDGKLVTSME